MRLCTSKRCRLCEEKKPALCVYCTAVCGVQYVLCRVYCALCTVLSLTRPHTWLSLSHSTSPFYPQVPALQLEPQRAGQPGLRR